jgi:hypothetical protein
MNILLAVFSFGFYRVNKVLLRGVQRLFFRLAPKRCTEWRPLSGEALKRPLALPIVITTGPRWNPHAIIAAVGPLTVQSSLKIDVPTAESSAKAWTAVVNAFPAFDTVGSLGSVSGAGDRLELPPGRYTVVLRYYEWNDAPRLPAIEVDGKQVVAATDIPSNLNDFYEELRGRTGFYYLCLHYYISVILRNEKRLSAAFVRGEYLPVGNPETEFFYGALQPGERLSLTSLKPLFQDHRLYGTVYNRASFPIWWGKLDESMSQLEAGEAGSYYLIRAHRATPAAEGARA